MCMAVVQDQYPAHQIQAHVPQHGPRYEHKNVPFEGTTTNQDAYKAYAIEPHRAMHAPVVARPYTKFEGIFTAYTKYSCVLICAQLLLL